MTPHWLLASECQFHEPLDDLSHCVKEIPFLYSTKITLKKIKLNWMVNCVVESFKDNNQSTISCSGNEDLIKVIKFGKFSAKCQKLVGQKNTRVEQQKDFELKVESLMCTISGGVINHHVTPSMGNVHGDILAFFMPGTTFHRKHIPVSSFFVLRFFNVS